MELRNSTDFADHFLRRMVSWCCKQLDLPAKACQCAVFTNTRDAYRGRAWSHGRILVRIGSEFIQRKHLAATRDGEAVSAMDAIKAVRGAGLSCSYDRDISCEGVVYRIAEVTKQVPRFPVRSRYPRRRNAPSLDLQDRAEALVCVTAHELEHLARWHEGIGRHREARVDGVAHAVVLAFRESRESLLEEWGREPRKRQSRPKLSRAEVNEAKARAKLAEWERKAKLAKTKLAIYRRKVRYYDCRAEATAAKS